VRDDHRHFCVIGIAGGISSRTHVGEEMGGLEEVYRLPQGRHRGDSRIPLLFHMVGVEFSQRSNGVGSWILGNDFP